MQIGRLLHAKETGLIAVILGAVFLLVGILISLTLIGAVIGVPLALFGLLLVLRGIF